MSPHSLPKGGIHLGPAEGKAFWLLADLHRFKIGSESTHGAFVLAEVMAGTEMDPPPHVHHLADEYFYILEGSFDFWLAGHAFSAGPGEFVHLPKRVLHTHKAGGGAPAKALVIQSPAGVERFIAEAGTPATDPSIRPALPEPAEFVRIIEIAHKHGIEVPS